MWGEYKTLAAVTTAVKQHLSSCLGEEVATMVYNTYGKAGYEDLDEAALMKAARGLVVKTRNRLVMELQLKKIMQSPDQPVQSFLASLKPIARNCKFQMECTATTCKQTNDFTDKMVLTQIIYGLADEDIQRKILGKTEMTL